MDDAMVWHQRGKACFIWATVFLGYALCLLVWVTFILPATDSVLSLEPIFPDVPYLPYDNATYEGEVSVLGKIASLQAHTMYRVESMGREDISATIILPEYEVSFNESFNAENRTHLYGVYRRKYQDDACVIITNGKLPSGHCQGRANLTHATTSLCNALLEDVVISVQRVSSSTWPLPFLLIVQRTALPYHTTMLQCLHASALLVVFSTVFTILLYVCIPVVCCCSCCCFVHAACFRCASGRRKSTAQQHSSQQVDMTSGAEWTEENDGMDEEEAMSWVEMQAMASSSDEEHL